MIDIEEIREYALGKPSTTEGFPFDETTLVFKVNNRMFLLLALDASPHQFNVKCDPDRAIQLREAYPDSVLPGYHMSKIHWNTIVLNGKISKKLIFDWIDHSYELVAKAGKKPVGSKKKNSNLPGKSGR